MGGGGSLWLVFQLLAKPSSNQTLCGRQVLAEWLRGTCNAEINPLFVFFRVYLGTAEWKNLCWPPSWKGAAGWEKRMCHHMSLLSVSPWLSVCRSAMLDPCPSLPIHSTFLLLLGPLFLCLLFLFFSYQSKATTVSDDRAPKMCLSSASRASQVAGSGQALKWIKGK